MARHVGGGLDGECSVFVSFGSRKLVCMVSFGQVQKCRRRSESF